MRVRLMTNSPTVFIMRSSRASAMRTDLTVEGPPGGGCFAAFFAGASICDVDSVSLLRRGSTAPADSAEASVSSGSSGANSLMRPSRESTPVRISTSSAHCRWSVFFRASTDSRHKSTTAGDGSISPSRKRPIKSSTQWAIAPSLLSPTCAAEPLTVCIARNSLFISSGLLLPSREIRQSLTTCRCSSASGWKNSRISSGTSSSSGSASK